MIAGINGSGSILGLYPQYQVNPVSAVRAVDTVNGVKQTECQTCKNRTYVDGSDESNVSFKAPGHISPSASASVIAAHEQEHVANAVAEGSKEGNQLISASVSLKMAVCPECGASYVSGGVTSTSIAYNVNNPYEQARKTIEGSFLAGMNFNQAA